MKVEWEYLPFLQLEFPEDRIERTGRTNGRPVFKINDKNGSSDSEKPTKLKKVNKKKLKPQDMEVKLQNTTGKEKTIEASR